MRRQHFVLALLAAVAVGFFLGSARGGNPNEKEVKPQRNVLDKQDIADPDSSIWALEFRFKGPRTINVDIPGKGRRVCWYLWYQVINRTKEPRLFIPDFELVTLDKEPKVYQDQILPKVQDDIIKVEDPAGYLKIRNSVTISAEPIPMSKPEAVPISVTGVAIWDNVPPDATNFNIFVSGLSNGWAVTDPIPPDTNPVVRRKTLKLTFKKQGGQFQFLGPAEWIYRGSNLKVPGLEEAFKDRKP